MKIETYNKANSIMKKLEENNEKNEMFDDFIAGKTEFKINIITDGKFEGAKATLKDNITPSEISEIFMLLDDLRTKEKEDLENELDSL